MPSPRLMLAEHHKALEAYCLALRTSAFTDDPPAVIARFRDLERAVLMHMRAEEQEMLPGYTKADAADAALILATHEELRALLYRLGVQAELHCIRLETIDMLVAILREHAAHEELTLYPWAERNLSIGSRRALFHTLTKSVQRLSGTVPTSPMARVHS